MEYESSVRHFCISVDIWGKRARSQIELRPSVIAEGKDKQRILGLKDCDFLFVRGTCSVRLQFCRELKN